MADRLISADALKANATREYKKYAVAATLLGFGKAFREIFAAFIEEIDNAPTIEAEPKHGRWMLNRQGNWACSLCGNDPYHDNMKNMNYCPNCGAKMDEVESDAETLEMWNLDGSPTRYIKSKRMGEVEEC